jgi:tetratricopeptide (TPR) repeat protein
MAIGIASAHGLQDDRSSAFATGDTENHHATIHAEQLRKLAAQALTDSRLRLRRGATHSAKQYAMEALRLSIDIQDIRAGGNQHATDLRSAQNAIRESRDFYRIARSVDWRAIQRMVFAHETEVLKESDLRQWSSLRATESYLNDAQQKLVSAIGQSRQAAESLVLLGVIEKAFSDRQDLHSGAVALTYHAAATQSTHQSPDAYREYGRTLLEQGLADQAVDALKRSVKLRPSRLAFQCLLDASRRAGDFDLAQFCIQALQDPRLLNDSLVVQLPPSQFAATYRPTQPISAESASTAAAPKADALNETDLNQDQPQTSFRSFFSFGQR